MVGWVSMDWNQGTKILPNILRTVPSLLLLMGLRRGVMGMGWGCDWFMRGMYQCNYLGVSGNNVRIIRALQLLYDHKGLMSPS